uniref:Short chain dehydrogenase/reductase dmxR8 n=1 Tax=Cryptosporiopsis sp. (strain 8999) TaxID=2572248 RepID=DMXR8_CRYX8|nr:RecName: Full=Short chain dehydrogenase/reductase dmxR8; Short=SDR dmxR8; AltName: Full=Dimeric xanthone biosynthesis cluster protein R8 [Cryptosporiopsis sp. 8999]QCL09099.1 DmxR8 [Cryptosporiopsis sp. 8999]
MGFLYSQLFKSLPYPTGNYSGKTIVITGSNVGLGKEAARHYVRLGASKMILAVRSLDKGHDAKHDIEGTTKCADNVIEVWKLDMASYDSVQKFAARVVTELPRVDIFIANAGIAPGSYRTAEDNESSITVNVVSTFLLAALVMPKMKSTAATFKTRPTFTITSSDVHGHTTFPQKSAPDGQIIATVNDKATAEKIWDDMYPISKLLEVLGVRSIAEQNPASKFPVTINCVNPGLCHSELGRDFPTIGFWLIKFFLARTTEVGSRTLVHAGSQGEDSHGQYMSDCEIGTPAPFVTSVEGKETQDRVWNELVKKLDAIKPGVTSNF